MKHSYEIIALFWIQLLQSTDGQATKDRYCFCKGVGSPRGCNFHTLYCSPPNNNCNKENVALGKNVTFSSLFREREYYPEERELQGCLAANGFTAPIYAPPNEPKLQWNCYHSGLFDLSPEWEVKLGEIYTINEITVTTRLAFERRMVSTIVAVDNIVCYRFPTDSRSSALALITFIKVSPPLKGSRVKIYKTKFPRPADNAPVDDHLYFLNLCEVQVWVCRRGFYGDQCHGVCHDACINCDNMDGTCHGGCKDGHYGTYCDKSCGQCHENRCVQSTGNCPSGKCQPGWSGVKCDTACQTGYYGANCQNKCGVCTGNTVCSRIDGRCVSGCDPGWSDSLCNAACANGSWGLNCSNNCGTCANGGTCEPSSGICTMGCEAGWQPDMCNKPCPNQTYGPSCSLACGNCKKGTSCNIITGACPQGCEDGWMSAKCNEQCPENFYGNGCNATCGKCAGDSPCYPGSGECPLGCLDGWLSEYCNKSCSPGTFGKNCSSACNVNCKDNLCHTENGACTHGCVSESYKGSHCKDADIREEKAASKFSALDPLFVVGILALAVLVATIMIVAVWRRKKSGEKEPQLIESPIEVVPTAPIVPTDIVPPPEPTDNIQVPESVRRSSSRAQKIPGEGQDYEEGDYGEESYQEGSYQEGSYQEGSYQEGSYRERSYQEGSYRE